MTITNWCIQRLAAAPAASSVASTDFPCFIAWSLHPPCLVQVSSRTSTLPTAVVWCRVFRKSGLEPTERNKGTLFFPFVCRDVAGMSTVLCDSMECEVHYRQMSLLFFGMPQCHMMKLRTKWVVCTGHMSFSTALSDSMLPISKHMVAPRWLPELQGCDSVQSPPPPGQRFPTFPGTAKQPWSCEQSWRKMTLEKLLFCPQIIRFFRKSTPLNQTLNSTALHACIVQITLRTCSQQAVLIEAKTTCVTAAVNLSETCPDWRAIGWSLLRKKMPTQSWLQWYITVAEIKRPNNPSSNDTLEKYVSMHGFKPTSKSFVH